jgi:hypothetical protein
MLFETSIAAVATCLFYEMIQCPLKSFRGVAEFFENCV